MRPIKNRQIEFKEREKLARVTEILIKKKLRIKKRWRKKTLFIKLSKAKNLLQENKLKKKEKTIFCKTNSLLRTFTGSEGI